MTHEALIARLEALTDSRPYGDFYRVFTDGTILSLFGKPHILKPSPHPRGYLRVSVTVEGKRLDRKVHQIVAQAFLDRPDGSTMVCHKDGNPSHNDVSNLYWGTTSSNARDSVRHGTCRAPQNSRATAAKRSGSDACMAKLDWEKVRDIRRRRAAGESLVSIGAIYGVDQSNVSRIALNKTWREDTNV